MKIIQYDKKYDSQIIDFIAYAKSKIKKDYTVNEDLYDIQKNYIDSGDMFWLGIDNDGKLICTLGFNAIPATTEVILHRFYVEPELKRQGLGTQMLKYAENYIKSLGKTAIRANLGRNYLESHKFYPKNGYTFYDELKVIKYL